MLLLAGVAVVIILAIRNFWRNNFSQAPKYVKQREEDAKRLADPANKLPTFKEAADTIVKTYKAPESERIQWRQEWAQKQTSLENKAVALAFGILIAMLAIGALLAH